jgi:HTH-type transcriptional regulator/antitoxin HigA
MEMTVADIAYKELLASELPHALHTPEEYDEYLARVEELLNIEARSEAEERYLELLSILIERYEEEYESISAPDALTALKELMAANNVSQAELSKLIGSSGLTSMILSGQRDLSKSQIKLLAQRFNVSPALFV